MSLIPVILCGGSGTRLWPMSREACPKQFLPLAGGGRSPFVAMLECLRGLPEAEAQGARPRGEHVSRRCAR